MILIQPTEFFSYGPDPTQTPPSQHVTDTIDHMQLPVNCVVIGNQPEEKKSRFVTDFSGVLKNIFRE